MILIFSPRSLPDPSLPAAPGDAQEWRFHEDQLQAFQKRRAGKWRPQEAAQAMDAGGWRKEDTRPVAEASPRAVTSLEAVASHW